MQTDFSSSCSLWVVACSLFFGENHSMNKTLALVLGGGRGTRLYPLTKFRSKPAVPLAGKYRLDRHSAIELHQQRREPDLRADAVQLGEPAPPHSPHLRLRSIRRRLCRNSGRPANARNTPTGIREPPTPCGKTCATCEQSDVEHVLILSGDQLYRMNFADMLATIARPGPT